jgi:hypothetical protein
MERFPSCETSVPNSIRHSRNAQLPEGERPVVWENPHNGEVRYLHTDHMESHYKSQGFEKKEFPSYYEHKKWCDEHGVVNHALEGIKDEALVG